MTLIEELTELQVELHSYEQGATIRRACSDVTTEAIDILRRGIRDLKEALAMAPPPGAVRAHFSASAVARQIVEPPPAVRAAAHHRRLIHRY